MRRGLIYALAVCLLACLISFTAPQAQAAEHTHCVCGGHSDGVGDHVCSEPITWEPWDGTGALQDGHSYYLNDTDGDSVITLSSTITLEDKHINLCLNGVELTSTSRTFLLKGKKTAGLSICDCGADADWGCISSTSTGIAPVLHSYTNKNASEMTINLYSGHMVAKDNNGQEANSAGGVLRLGNNTAVTGSTENHKGTFNMYGGHISGGMAQENGGNVYVSIDCEFNMYGGTIVGGQAGGEGDNLFVAGLLNLQGGTITSGNVEFSTDAGKIGSMTVGGKVKALVYDQQQVLQGSYETVADALSSVQTGQYIQLAADAQENITVSKTVYLDMNGYDLSGVTVEDTLYAFDSAAHKGVLSCSGKPADLWVLAGASYKAVPVEGGYSFYGLQAAINKISIKPDTAAVGYKARFDADAELRDEIHSFGYKLWIREDMVVTRSLGAEEFTSGRELTLRLNNILKTDNDFLTNYNNADTKIHAQVFIRLQDGSTVASAEVSYDLRQMLELADAGYDGYSTAQKTALQNMNTTYEQLLLGWDLPNIHHAKGNGWVEVDAAGFAALLTNNGGTFTLNGQKEPYSLMAPGKYILTEDVTLKDMSIRIATGNHVSICLNGHTISSNTRVFKVRGTLDICDCSETDGTITSSFTGNNGAYAPIAYVYNGTMNIYGGNLEATGQVTAAGVLATGKSGSATGTLNIYGGTVSGGNTSSNSGLIALWDASSVNMYGGKLYGGRTAGSGGGISIGNGSRANLYGGEIFENTANTGGGVYITSGETQVYMGSRLVIRDNTATTGGNVQHNSDITVTIDGTTITGGSADMGGGVYTAGASVKLEGDAVIRENTTGSLYLNAGVELDVAGLTQGADVHLYNMSSMFLGSDATVLKYMTLERSGYKTATIAGKLVLVPESFAIPTEVEGFQVGFGRADITPTEVGIPLAGYGNAAQRLSKDMGANEYDKLMVTTVAITDENGQTVLLMSVDLIRPSAALISTILPAVSAATGVPEGNIFTTFTHTHSVPETNQTTHPTIKRYNAMLPDRFAESANLAMADRAAAAMEIGSFEVEGLNFTRHYTYQDADGVWQYFGDNFGTATYNSTTDHVTEADHTMHLVKFTRDGKDILMANWRVHPHMTGGSAKTVVSADIIGTTRYYLETLSDELSSEWNIGEDGMYFMYLQGAAGNVNEKSKIKSEQHGYSYTEYGNQLAAQMLVSIYPDILKLLNPGLQDVQIPSCLGSVENIGNWQVDNYSYTATADISTDEEYNKATAARDAYNAWLAKNPNATSAQRWGKCEELGYLNHFHFDNVITRHGLDETYQLPLNTFSLGDNLAFFTAPGELWDTVSMEVEEASPFAMTMCIGYSQDHYNYFVYDPTNGGEMTYESYESNNYRFVAPDTVNDMIAYWKQTLDELYSNLEN